MLLLATVHWAGSGATADASGLGMGVVLMTVGMSVVFGSLALMLAVVTLLGRSFKPREKPAAAAPTQRPSAPAASEEPGVSPELVAVLTAAAVAATQKQVRIRRVTVVGQTGGTAWIAGGRSSLMGSHLPARRRA